MDFVMKKLKTTALNGVPGAALLDVSNPSSVHHSPVNSSSKSAAACLKFFAYREGGRAHLPGTATPFSAFCVPISTYQELQIEVASPARQIGPSSCRHMALQGWAPASSILSWGHGNTSVSGGFTCHLWQGAVPLFLERFQRWTEHQTPGEDDCLITLHDAWACPELADAHGDISHCDPAVPQPPLTCMPSSHGVPKSLWHNLRKQDYKHIKYT